MTIRGSINIVLIWPNNQFPENGSKGEIEMESMTTLGVGSTTVSARPPVKREVRLLAASVVRLLIVWRQRSQNRRALLQMDRRMLMDIGISAADAEKEARKPFWTP